ncbi:MAG: hypothetical protein NC452_03900 [Eubacterium sp.]|nr:hypothetical protein [Eubacterium sp.]
MTNDMEKWFGELDYEKLEELFSEFSYEDIQFPEYSLEELEALFDL